MWCGYLYSREWLELEVRASDVNAEVAIVERRYFWTLNKPRNQIQRIDSASLCSLAGRNDNPTRFLVPIDYCKVPAVGSIPASSNTAESGGWQMRQCKKYWKCKKNPTSPGKIFSRDLATVLCWCRQSDRSYSTETVWPPKKTLL